MLVLTEYLLFWLINDQSDGSSVYWSRDLYDIRNVQFNFEYNRTVTKQTFAASTDVQRESVSSSNRRKNYLSVSPFINLQPACIPSNWISP